MILLSSAIGRRTYIDTMGLYHRMLIHCARIDQATLPGRRRKSVRKGENKIRLLTVDYEYLLLISVMCITRPSTRKVFVQCFVLVFSAMAKLTLPGILPAAASQVQKMMLMEKEREEHMKIIATSRKPTFQETRTTSRS